MAEPSRVIANAQLHDFFRTELNEATAHLGVQISDITEYYVVDLLCSFARQDAGPRPSDEPLALIYKRASEANLAERTQILRQMGDMALYVSGFFAEFIERSLVDLNYYIGMGGHAYQNVASLVASCHQGAVLSTLYGQLAVKFAELVDVLNQVSDRSKEHIDNHRDLLRLYDRWVRTGSQRTRKLLVEQGLIPTGGIPKEYNQ